MSAYIARRILFMIPTLFGIMLVSFLVVQFAPGGPVERVIAQLRGSDTGATSRISGSTSGDFAHSALQAGSQFDVSSKYRGAQGLDPAFIKSLEKQFGFDKPAYERFFLMMWNYLRFDFGKSYFRDVSVLELIKEAGRITGVLADIDGERRTISARRGVVLACGGFEWNSELVALTQQADHVAARLKNSDGSTREVAAAWIGGCDGAHSAVRHGLGLGFLGGTYDQLFYVADAEDPTQAREEVGRLVVRILEGLKTGAAVEVS